MVARLVLFQAVFIGALLSDDLISVVVIYRHGDRTPIAPYATDPYKNVSSWPVGFGQLTNVSFANPNKNKVPVLCQLGKQQQYELGRWLRQRYQEFLPNGYSEEDVYVHSTDVDRTLMSAAANLAGLFNPEGDQVWDAAVPWQPIPIHTIPKSEDNFLFMGKDCPRFEKLREEVLQDEYFLKFDRDNADLYASLTQHSGTTIDSLESLEGLYDTLYIENLYNLTLPEWTNQFFPDNRRQGCISFAINTYTEDLARLQTGPLFNKIIENFHKATSGGDFFKLLVFSGHDTTIASLLNTMGAFEYHCPPYTSTIIIELRRNMSSYVNIFYKNSSELQDVTLDGCDFNCEFEEFLSTLAPIAITRDQRDEECELVRYYRFSSDDLGYAIAFVVILGLIIFILTVNLLWMCWRRNKMQGEINDKKPSGCI